MALPTQWTWVWVDSGNWWWTGRPGVLQSMVSQRIKTQLSDWTEWKVSQWSFPHARLWVQAFYSNGPTKWWSFLTKMKLCLAIMLSVGFNLQMCKSRLHVSIKLFLPKNFSMYYPDKNNWIHSFQGFFFCFFGFFFGLDHSDFFHNFTMKWKQQFKVLTFNLWFKCWH